jgi:hypothetical protein
MQMQVNENIRAFWRIISNMELIDMEVDWKTDYLKINSFRRIKKDSEEYLELVDKKIKIKYLGGFDRNYYSQMRLLIEEVRNEFQDLDSDGKKIFIDRINDKLKFIRDCVDRVIELKAMFKHDRESFNHVYFALTMRLTSNLFIETLSRPLNMGLVSSSYQTRDFINNGETVYLSERLLTAIYNNLRAREDSLIEVLEIYPSIVKFKPIESDDLVPPLSVPSVNEKPLTTRQQNTIKTHLGYINFYIRERSELNKNHDRATRNTTKHFNISDKTLKRAMDNNRTILDNYNFDI